MGTLSAKACAKPPMEFSEPGPPWVITTPNLLRSCMRLNPSAAIKAPRSCRNMIGRMPSLATSSMRLFDGKHATHSTPSAFRSRATACSVFILGSPPGFVRCDVVKTLAYAITCSAATKPPRGPISPYHFALCGRLLSGIIRASRQDTIQTSPPKRKLACPLCIQRKMSR